LKTPAASAINVDVSMVVMMMVMVGGVASLGRRRVDLDLAKVSSMGGVADARKSVDAIDALSVI